MQNALVNALAIKQAELKLTERQLAKLLGLHHSTLQQLRSGQRQPGRKVLNAIALNFPEMTGLLIAFIIK